MERRHLIIDVTYTLENSEITKKELKDEENRVIEYIRELIESDFHETYNLKIKRYNGENLSRLG